LASINALWRADKNKLFCCAEKSANSFFLASEIGICWPKDSVATHSNKKETIIAV